MKQRADELLVQRGLATTRSRARALIMAGQVRMGDRVIDKAGTMLDQSAELEVEQPPRFVSRGGEKLSHAIEAFNVDPTGWVCADIGASTGGFTDVLLQAGASRIYSIDVGYGQLDYRLRTDERVVVMERVNARHIESLPEPVDLVTIDVSFISLALIFPAVLRILKHDGLCIALVKPQFEAGREHVGKGGVVRDPETHARVIRDIVNAAGDHGLSAQDITFSPITGPAGNREFLLRLRNGSAHAVDLSARIREVIHEPGPRKESDV